jgi:hypothetical protein
MALATDVKIFRSTDGGAPTLNGAAGALSSLLHACLVTGYNTQVPAGITRDGTTVTVTFGSAHGYVEHQVVNISGANESDYNGDFRITSVTSTTFTFELAGGITPTTPATGTFASKVAPAGWTRPYSDTNKAVFKPSDAAATGCRLRIDDTNAATRRSVVRGYVSMTDLDSGTEPFPASASLYWHKSTDDATSRVWFVAADSRLFYLGMANNGTTYADLHMFGDIVSYKPGDAYHCVLTGSPSSSSDTIAGSLMVKCLYAANIYASAAISVARGYAGITGTPYPLGVYGFMIASTSSAATLTGYALPIGNNLIAYPHAVDNGIVFGNLFMVEYGSVYVVRGYPPGIYDPWHAPITSYNVPLILDDIPSANRKAIAWAARAYQQTGGSYWFTNSTVGVALIDITGPWR